MDDTRPSFLKNFTAECTCFGRLLFRIIYLFICISAHLAVGFSVALRVPLHLQLCLARSNSTMGYDSPASTMAVCVVLLVINIVVVILRFSARRVQQAPIKLDDLLVLPALALLIAMGAIGIYGVKKKGYGTPEATAGNNTKNSGVGWTDYGFELVQTPTYGFIKLAALLFFRRIFCIKGSRDRFYITTLMMIVVIVLWTVAFEVLAASRCGTHPSALWSGSTNYFKYCSVALPYLLSFSISDFITDLMILLVPIPRIWLLKMSIGRKIGVTIIFLSASVGLAASIARMVNIAYTYNHARERTADPRLEDTQVVFWSMLEGGLALIAVNLPSVWGLFTRISPEAVLRSVRSMVSIGSRSSGDSKKSRTSYRQTKKSPLTSSHEDIVYKDGREHGAEVYAMHDIDMANHNQQPPLPERIVVSNSITQTNSMV